MKPTPTATFPKPFHPEEREAHIGNNRDVVRWILEAQICFKRKTLPLQESCTLTNLPVSPDKAAVLLLLARNECVGVSSLLTMLLSHGLSCRRRAKRHHISKMLAIILSRGKRAQSTYRFHMLGLRGRPGFPRRTAGEDSGQQELCSKEQLFCSVAFLQMLS